MEKIDPKKKIGWISAGQTGYAMARRLLDSPADLGSCDVIFTHEVRGMLAELGASMISAPVRGNVKV